MNQASLKTPRFAHEKRSRLLVFCTFATIVKGMVMAITGLRLGTIPEVAVIGFALAAFGMVLIVTQYASTYRRNFFCLIVASCQLALCSLLYVPLLLTGHSLLLLPLILSVLTLFLNLTWGISVSEQHAYAPSDRSTEQITLQEILGGILILAMILGPASFFYR